jgi:hypothetical protein
MTLEFLQSELLDRKPVSVSEVPTVTPVVTVAKRAIVLFLIHWMNNNPFNT